MRAMLHQTTMPSSSVRLSISLQQMRTAAELWTWKNWRRLPARPSRKPQFFTQRPTRMETALSASLNSFRRRPQKKQHPCPNPSHPYEGLWDSAKQRNRLHPFSNHPLNHPSSNGSSNHLSKAGVSHHLNRAGRSSNRRSKAGRSNAPCNRKHRWCNPRFDPAFIAGTAGLDLIPTGGFAPCAARRTSGTEGFSEWEKFRFQRGPFRPTKRLVLPAHLIFECPPLRNLRASYYRL